MNSLPQPQLKCYSTLFGEFLHSLEDIASTVVHNSSITIWFLDVSFIFSGDRLCSYSCVCY